MSEFYLSNKNGYDRGSKGHWLLNKARDAGNTPGASYNEVATLIISTR